MVNMNFRPNQPFVGQSAFAHKGGMHVSGVSRIAASYEHIDPERVGNERRMLVSELSGRSNIVAMAAAAPHPRRSEADGRDSRPRRLDGERRLPVRGGRRLVRPAGAAVRRHVPPALRAAELSRQRGDQRRGEIRTEATVKIRIGDEFRHEVAEGDGPVNALDAAMRKALNGSFPNLAKLHLVDYKVRVINSEAATAAGVRVVIESQDEDDVWGTVGVSENVIEASWIALVDSFEYKLFKDEEGGSLSSGRGPG